MQKRKDDFYAHVDNIQTKRGMLLLIAMFVAAFLAQTKFAQACPGVAVTFIGFIIGTILIKLVLFIIITTNDGLTVGRIIIYGLIMTILIPVIVLLLTRHSFGVWLSIAILAGELIGIGSYSSLTIF